MPDFDPEILTVQKTKLEPATIQRANAESTTQDNNNNELLKTIVLPKNLKNLGHRLPKAKYDDEIRILVKEREEDSFNPQEPDAEGVLKLQRNISLPVLSKNQSVKSGVSGEVVKKPS